MFWGGMVGQLREERSLKFMKYGTTANIISNAELRSDSNSVVNKSMSTNAMCIA